MFDWINYYRFVIQYHNMYKKEQEIIAFNNTNSDIRKNNKIKDDLNDLYKIKIELCNKHLGDYIYWYDEQMNNKLLIDTKRDAQTTNSIDLKMRKWLLSNGLS
jgi:hypothetical protein